MHNSTFQFNLDKVSLKYATQVRLFGNRLAYDTEVKAVT